MNQLTTTFLKPPTNQVTLHFRRFELKYVLSVPQYQAVHAVISQRLPADPYANKHGFYYIASLYYDTPAYKSYLDTKAGIRNRVKYRLRSYSHQAKASPQVFWEIKRKFDMAVVKDRGVLSTSQTQQTLNHPTITHPDAVISQYLAAMRRYPLNEKVIIRYKREPFMAENPEIRVTFDHEIVISTPKMPYEADAEGFHILGNGVIMEIKFIGSLPKWLGRVIMQFDLQRVPFSKYVLGLERAKKHLSWIHP